jgi:hypothetical protein
MTTHLCGVAGSTPDLIFWSEARAQTCNVCACGVFGAPRACVRERR